jgi:rSAM/selenodomain-associated transferase 1
MPERIAKTDPFKQIDDYVGSGPMKFIKSEWVPGAKAVFEKFVDYKPRQEKASWLAGGKNMLVDRIEWVVMPDPATASAALQNGEVDWWENPISDLVPLLKKNRNISVDIADPLGNIGSFRMNHLYPPFNDVKVRRAVLMALDQEEYMRALVGDGPEIFPQQGDTLGDRMRNAFGRLFAAGYSTVVMIGSDLPSLPTSHLAQAFQYLRDRPDDLVIGPANDGGYYLIGLRRLRPALFTSIPWGTADVLTTTTSIAETCGLTVSFVSPWHDVDTVEDLRQVLRDPYGATRTRAWVTAHQGVAQLVSDS